MEHATWQSRTCTRLSNSAQKAERSGRSGKEKIEQETGRRRQFGWAVHLHDVGVVKLGERHEPLELLQPRYVAKLESGKVQRAQKIIDKINVM